MCIRDSGPDDHAAAHAAARAPRPHRGGAGARRRPHRAAADRRRQCGGPAARHLRVARRQPDAHRGRAGRPAGRAAARA
eukprot:6741515-Prymnesium_polylepis.1